MEAAISRQQQVGLDLFKQKKHNEAVDCFTKIITEYINPPVEIYDCRAGCYLRLNDLRNALKDGNTMMRIARRNAKGYLRTGQILQKMGRNDKALAIYRYGLENVPTTDPQKESIQYKHDTLSSRCSPLKAFDPFLMLPLELVEMMLDYLPFPDLVNLLRVSMQWKEFLRSMPRLWRHLDFSLAKKDVKPAAVRRYSSWSQKMVSRATLYRADTANGDVLKYLFGNCPNLAHLELVDGVSNDFLVRAATYAPRLTTLILGQHRHISLDMVTQVLENCRNLVRAEFQSIVTKLQPDAVWRVDLPNLRTIHLIGVDDHPMGNVHRLKLDELFTRIPNIHDIKITNWNVRLTGGAPDFSNLQQLESLVYEGFPPDHTPVLPPSIRSLCLLRSFGLGIKDLDKLTSLSLPESGQVLSSDLWTLLEAGKGNLERLILNHSTQFDMERLVIDMCSQGYFPKIEELSLKEFGITDTALQSLATSCPLLKTLNVSYNEKITGVGVATLVTKKGEKLRELDLTHCGGVGRDAVDWARRQGVRVVYRFPQSKSKQGRRVRYG